MLVDYEKSENIDAKGKHVNEIENDIALPRMLMKYIRLLLSKSGSHWEEQKKSEVHNSSIELNHTTDPIG